MLEVLESLHKTPHPPPTHSNFEHGQNHSALDTTGMARQKAEAEYCQGMTITVSQS